jgi:transposase
VLEAVVAGALRQTEAAAALGLSDRQVRRLLATFRAGGPAALVHGNTGRTPWQAVPDATRAQVVDLVRARYAGLSQAEAVRRLAEEHGIVLHRTTLARILAGVTARRGPTAAAAPVRPAPEAPSQAGHQCLGRGSVPGCRCA